MKKYMILGLIIIIVIFAGCVRKTYAAPINQPFENAVSIDLLDTHDGEEVLCTLTGPEMEKFWEQFAALEFRRYFNDPATEYGPIAVRVHYADGYYDTIGVHINGYYDDTGKSLRAGGWYYLTDAEEEKLVALVEQYVDASVLTTGD